MSTSLDLQISPHHFSGGHPYGRQIFKSSVAKVEIEVTSYCNRVCPFCPNSFLDRRSVKHHMDDAIYDQVLRDLASIDYSGTFCFARYCEPLAEPDFFLARLRRCRDALPNAQTVVYSNGDYLTPDYLDELHAAGLRVLVIGVYLGEQQAYDPVLMRARVLARLDDLGHPYRLVQDEPAAIVARVAYKPGMSIMVRGRNLDDPPVINGIPLKHDRAGTIATKTPFRRRSPCFTVFSELQIECDGTIVPCCNIRGDNPAHRDYLVGVIGRDGSIFDIWSNATMAAWRRSLFLFGDKDAPCSTCTYRVQLETPTAVARIQAAAEQLGLAATSPVGITGLSLQS